jgi:hypothetical protein
MAAQAPGKRAVMVHFKYKTFSEEVCRPVSFIGGKEELRDAVLTEFSDVLPRTEDTVMLAVRFYI